MHISITEKVKNISWTNSFRGISLLSSRSMDPLEEIHFLSAQRHETAFFCIFFYLLSKRSSPYVNERTMIIEIHSHGSHFVRPLHGETVQLFVFSRQRSESSFIHRISANCVPTERLSHSTEEDFLSPPPGCRKPVRREPPPLFSFSNENVSRPLNKSRHHSHENGDTTSEWRCFGCVRRLPMKISRPNQESPPTAPLLSSLLYFFIYYGVYLYIYQCMYT